MRKTLIAIPPDYAGYIFQLILVKNVRDAKKDSIDSLIPLRKEQVSMLHVRWLHTVMVPTINSRGSN
jgi:hypothetical protein